MSIDISLQEPDVALFHPRAGILKEGMVQPFTWELAADASRLADMLECLSGDEVTRAASFKFEKERRRFIVSRYGMRSALGMTLGDAPESLRFEYSPRGKPSLWGQDEGTGLQFNLSHSADTALLVVAWGKDLGVDIEQVRDDAALAEMAEFAFTGPEREWLSGRSVDFNMDGFFRIWTLKEALLKASGVGLAAGLKRFEVLPMDGGKASVIDREASSKGQGWVARNFEVCSGYQAALAYCRSASRNVELLPVLKLPWIA